MKFSEIANRLTGVSTPVGGVSWQPAELEVAGARRVVAFLEDRRVLYDPCESELAASLRAMRAACSKFLERVGTDGREGIRHASSGGYQSWTFGSCLGELRGTFGVHVAKIAAQVQARRGGQAGRHPTRERRRRYRRR